MNIDNNMQGFTQAAKDYRQASLPVEAPFQVSGPSAESVNNTPQSGPMTKASFYARGGLANTAKNLVNNIQKAKQEREAKKAYEKYLMAGEQGADEAYKEAAQIIGKDVNNWVPPKSFYYDKDGVFLPQPYARAVLMGVFKYREKQAEEAKKVAKQSEYQTVGGVLQTAKTPQEAAANMGKLGYNPEDYTKAAGTIPTAKDEAGVNLTNAQIKTQEAEQALKKAQADWNRRRSSTPSGSGSGNQKDYHFEQAKKDYSAADIEKTRVSARIKNLEKQKKEAEEIGEDTTQFDEQIAVARADLEVANTHFKKAKGTVNALASKKTNEGRTEYWNETLATEVDPAVKTIADIIDSSIAREILSISSNTVEWKRSLMN